MREERRWVSVLFVDMVGFTALAARLDPEDVRALQMEYFGRVGEVIRRRRGVVEKYVGDAVLAVFGAPDSDEYDAYRAVLAGLEIQEALAGLTLADGSPIRARVGIATGEVVVDLAAAHDGGQALVCGDVVNTAARVQAHAEPGTVVVTSATRRATEPMVRYRDLPAIMPAGKPAAVDVWRAESVAPLPAADPHDAAPMVGREAELSTLTRAVTAGTPALVSVVGPAGIGKSHLVREVATRLGATGWWFGHCPPCGGGRYEPLADMVRRQAELRGGDARRRLAGWAGGLVSAEELPRVLDGLAALLGLPGGRAELIEPALLRVLRAAARQPLVLVFEDLHHADDAMIRFVRELSALPLAVVVTSRSEMRLGETVALRPLGVRETRRLLGQLLHRAAQPAALADRLLPLVGGTPGYAEEYVRMFADQGLTNGADELPVPERVRAIVSARLGHVDEPDRAVLQAAAVLGDLVRPDAVAALLDADAGDVLAALRRLERRGLLVRRMSPAVAGRAGRRASPTVAGRVGTRMSPAVAAGQFEYAFGEVVVRQVVYARLPRALRADHHRRAAEWLSAIAADPRPMKPVGMGPSQRFRCGVDEERARHWLAVADLARALHRDARPYLAAAHAARRAVRHGFPGRAGALADRTRGSAGLVGGGSRRIQCGAGGPATPIPTGPMIARRYMDHRPRPAHAATRGGRSMHAATRGRGRGP